MICFTFIPAKIRKRVRNKRLFFNELFLVGVEHVDGGDQGGKAPHRDGQLVGHAAERAAEAEAERARMLEQEAKAIEAYVTANNITDTPTESGIYLFPTKEGEGELAKWGDDVAVHYVLRNLQGEQIESSYDYGQPMVFKIGSGEMIPAVEEAVMTLSQGAKVTVLTPSSQAFGEFDLGEMLPPFTPLLIDLELVEIK